MENDYCLLWPNVNEFGYPETHNGVLVHRMMWELTRHRRIPKGMVIHHICEQKSCVFPKHLRLLTPGLHVKLHAKLKGLEVNTCEWEPWPYGASPNFMRRG